MHTGVKLRIDIHNILYEIHKLNKTMNSKNIQKIINSHKQQNIAFINNVCMNTMRYSFHTQKIIDLFVKKNPKINELILLKSAITQIIFLNFKEYAVIDTSVEVAKKKNVYHGFINAVLKKIVLKKKELKKIEILFNDLPSWFRSRNSHLSEKEKKSFLLNLTKEPDLHLVFKNKNKLNEFEYDIHTTSKISGFLKRKINIKEIKSYEYGDWWVQDYSSFFPIYNLGDKIINGENIDLCSAPGGKAFQILAKGKNIILNDINKLRLVKLNQNINRLKYQAIVKNIDVLKMKEKKKYNFIILDAPCSSVGTIRKNPEIFFKIKSPDFTYLLKLQTDLLNKAASLIDVNGVILYMVCSFLKEETTDQLKKFLSYNKNFFIYEFEQESEINQYKKLVNNKIMLTLPESIMKYSIDGYFAVCLKKKK